MQILDWHPVSDAMATREIGTPGRVTESTKKRKSEGATVAYKVKKEPSGSFSIQVDTEDEDQTILHKTGRGARRTSSALREGHF